MIHLRAIGVLMLLYRAHLEGRAAARHARAHDDAIRRADAMQLRAMLAVAAMSRRQALRGA